MNMAVTVIDAFEFFQKNIVNLDQKISDNARSSRDWLIKRISEFPDKNPNFPLLYPEINIAFGSFARKTKTAPLDDIDLMIGLSADGCYYTEYSWDNITISFPENYKGYLKNYADTRDQSKLSSTRVTNAFKSELENVDQYSNADIKRNGEATTLKLKSYSWNFDIVPCFFTKTQYYLIPNGDGRWKRTNPRLDRDRVSNINQKQSGNVLNVIRILKYWKQEKKINIGSYLVEAMILYFYEDKEEDSCSCFVDIELVKIFTYLSKSILHSVPDPKKIQEDINDADNRYLLSEKFAKFANLSREARQLEIDGKIKESINKWKEVFGSAFPNYG